MILGGSDPALTGFRDSDCPERAVDVSPVSPVIILGSGRRFCATCMRVKTMWLVEYGPFNKHRRCFRCMTPAERSALREGY